MRTAARWFLYAAALTCLGDAIFAFIEFDHIGDLHVAWGYNSLFVGGTYLWIASKIP